MKKLLSVLLVLAMLMAVVPLTVSADGYLYGTNLVTNGDMESTITTPLIANLNEENNGTSTLTQVSNEENVVSNRVIKVVSRWGELSSGLCYDITTLMKQKDGNGDYIIQHGNGCLYIAAKIKLENPNDIAYVRPLLYGTEGVGSLRLSDTWATQYEVTGSEWTEVGTKDDANYYRSFAIYEMTAARLDIVGQKTKLVFDITSDATMETMYDGAYYIDDVSLFWVDGVDHTTDVTRQPSMLENSDFEELSGGNPIDYSATNFESWTGDGTTTWYADSAVIQNAVINEQIPGSLPYEPEGVHSGNTGLKVTDRPGTYQGLALDLKLLLAGLDTQPGESWHMSCWMKMVAPQTTMDVKPIWAGSADGSAWLNGDSELTITVTDQWTQIGYNSIKEEYYAIRPEGVASSAFNPNSGGWSNIWLTTAGSEADYYIDDIKVWKSGSSSDVTTEINSLPLTAAIVPTDKEAIEKARLNYASLATADKENVTNLAVLLAAEAELAKFDTKMTFPGDLSIVNGFAVTQPGRTKTQVLADIAAANGTIDIQTANEGTVLPAEKTASGMKAVLKYKDIELHSIYFAVLGDLDGDGKCTTADMVILKKKIVISGFTLDAMQTVSADFDGDDGITADELVALKKYILGIEDSLYIPQGAVPE